MILHKVSTSPFDDHALAQCLSLMSEGDGLLLLQDAVYAAHGEQLWSKQLEKVAQLYVLEEDAQARAISITHVKAKLINYSEFVSLSLHYRKVMSW